MKRRGFIVAITALAMLLGAVTTVLVSWFCFLRYPTLTLPRDINGIKRGSGEFAWPAPVPAGWPAAPDFCFPSVGWGTRREVCFAAAHDASTAEACTLTIDSGGWPMRGMKYRSWAWGIPGGTGINRVSDPYLMPPRWLQSRVKLAQFLVPLMPIPAGFAVNTALYTAAWLGLIACLLRVRRFLRLRAGLCPACKYPIGGSPVCTECGRELPARRQPA